jgi:hypothetical protein
MTWSTAALIAAYTLALLGMDALVGPTVFNRFASYGWPEVRAVITKNTYTGARRGGASVTFRYEVDGRGYEARDSGSSAWAADRWRGREVVAHYNPGRPSSAVLDVGPQPVDVMVLHLVGLHAIVLGLWIQVAGYLGVAPWVGRAVRARAIGSDPGVVRVRLPSLRPPVAESLLAAALAWFAGVLVLGIVYGRTGVPLSGAWASLASGAAVGALVYLGQRVAIALGRRDMIVDLRRRVLILPARCRRAEVPMDMILAVDLGRGVGLRFGRRPIGLRRPGPDSTTVNVVTATESFRIVDRPRREQAVEIAEWLRRQIDAGGSKASGADPRIHDLAAQAGI